MDMALAPSIAYGVGTGGGRERPPHMGLRKVPVPASQRDGLSRGEGSDPFFPAVSGKNEMPEERGLTPFSRRVRPATYGFPLVLKSRGEACWPPL